MKLVFFYGLFMDEDILKEQGVTPLDSKLVCLAEYGLRVGDRATLEYSESERVFGSLMRLDSKELERLYSEQSVADYVPIKVTTIDMQGKPIEAIAYILSMEKVSGKNRKYAKSLAEIAKKIGLPKEYVKEIEAWF